MLAILLWLLGTLIVAFYADDRKIGFWGAFVMSLFFSPVIGLIAAILSKTNARDRLEQEALMRATSGSTEQRPQHLSSTADEIAKLAELRERGLITDAEFETQKQRILRM